MIEDALQEGYAKGRDEGLAEGVIKGREEGRAIKKSACHKVSMQIFFFHKL